MVQPSPDASLSVTVDVDASNVPRDFQREVHRLGRDADRDFDDLGDDLSKALSRGLGRNIDRVLNDYFDGISKVLIEQTASLQAAIDKSFDDHRDGSGRRLRRAGERAASNFGEGFSNVFSRLGSVITGPLGAFFNVGGRSPLLLLLLPVLGAVIALITAAVYGLQALASQLFVIPSLLFAIGLQATALFLIFDGVGEVIGNVLSAKNADELAEALKGVNAELADVVKQLIPWRDFFSGLKDTLQTAFFGAIDDQLTQILENVREPLAKALIQISSGLGGAFATALEAFNTKEFAEFLGLIGESTAAWLEGLGPALKTLITGLTDLGKAMDPFLDMFGTGFNDFITSFGEWLSGLGEDPEFMQWMEDSIPIIKDFFQFLGGLWELIKDIIGQFIEADKEWQAEGGQSFLDQLTTSIGLFLEVLNSDTGKDAMKAFIVILSSLTLLFFVLAIGVLGLLAALEELMQFWFGIFEWLEKNIVGDDGIVSRSTKRIGEAGTALGEGLSTALADFEAFVGDIGEAVTGAIGSIATAISTGIDDIRTAVLGMFDDPGTFLKEAGSKLVGGLIEGLRSGIPGLNTAVSAIAGLVKSYWPFSPAEQGPLSGTGDLKHAGQSIVNQLVSGIKMEAPKLEATSENLARNFTFGPGAVQLIYNGGEPPSRQQAQMLGATAGRSLFEQLNNTQMAVRTL